MLFLWCKSIYSEWIEIDKFLAINFHSEWQRYTEKKPIPRLTKTDVSNFQPEEPHIHFYTVEKNPQMPVFHSKSNVFALKFQCKTVISKDKSQEIDFRFLKNIYMYFIYARL